MSTKVKICLRFPRTKKFETLPEPTRALKPHFVNSDPDGPLIVFVSKVGEIIHFYF